MAPKNHITIDRWDKDHWSTLGYIETRCVDHKGVPDRDHMRTDPDRHPGLIGPSMSRLMVSGTEKHPTRLKGGETVDDHDDWDCVDDMEAAGLLEWLGTGIHPVFKLTKLGIKLCNRLRNHKVAGGSYSNFDHEAAK